MEEAHCRHIEHLEKVLEKKKMQIQELSLTKKKEIYTNLSQEAIFQCSICIEMLLQPMITNCGHSFCNKCLARWTQESSTCPECRNELTHASRSYMAEEIINKIIENADPRKIEERRKQMNEESPVNEQEELPPNEEIEIIHLDSEDQISSTEGEDDENDPTYQIETTDSE